MKKASATEAADPTAIARLFFAARLHIAGKYVGMSGFTVFGGGLHPTTPASLLPADFQTAITNSALGRTTVVDNAVMGSWASGQGYCSMPGFRQQVYCACVNAPVANPTCIFAPCNLNSAAFKTTAMQRVAENAAAQCPQSVNCKQVYDMGGADNVASNVSQTINCGSAPSASTAPTPSATGASRENPLVAMAFMFLLLVIFVLVAFRDNPPDENGARDLEGGSSG
jgi:hypothetical protein